MEITIPEFALVVLVGASGSGKSTFAAAHFREFEVLSSDRCRGMVADDENDQKATQDAFDVLQYVAAKRLKNRRLAVIDATNVHRDGRLPLIQLARKYHAIPVAIVLKMPESVCRDRNESRTDRSFGRHVIRNQSRQLRQSIRGLKREGFRRVVVLTSPEEVENVSIVRQPLWTDRRTDKGPFDVIGDIHGCYEELRELLGILGYEVESNPSEEGDMGYTLSHPEGRRLIFLGDLVDRGPQNIDVLRLVMGAVKQGEALTVPGNHDAKLLKKLEGRKVQMGHGLEKTWEQLAKESDGFREAVGSFIRSQISHYVLDEGRLVVAHAGMKEEYQGRGSAHIRAFALYGETTGETDEWGLPIRHAWAEDYRGSALVVYGHTACSEPLWLNNTLCIDTGCVYGGRLTALRYPEKELVSVPARAIHHPSTKPGFPGPENSLDSASSPSAQLEYDDLLDIEDVLGKRFIETPRRRITLREENTMPAMEALSRFGVHPKWLVYLPPTMSPPATSNQEGYLERPEEVFDYYERQGLRELICQEKHMGSRAVVIVARSPSVIEERFGLATETYGSCLTRRGRRFFNDASLEFSFLKRLTEAVERAGLWKELDSDWMILDAELMPWSFKAMDLVKSTYASVGAAGSAALKEAVEVLEKARARGLPVGQILECQKDRQRAIEGYQNAYRRYCWSVSDLEELRFAPFHLMASEGKVHGDRDHLWHLDLLSRITDQDTILQTTPYRRVDLTKANSRNGAIEWWESLVGEGGEGMVVKPLDFTAKGKKGWVQPAIKCRGPEYLRIIYGAEYLEPSKLARLRDRGLSRKRSLAMREFELGLEALQRFVDRQPLRRVHECVLGVLALESEPVDPRL